MYSLLFSPLILGAASYVLVGREAATWTMVPKTCFDSVSDFENSFGYLYPWGSDHNGAARMDKDHIKISDGVLKLTVSPATGQSQPARAAKVSIYTTSLEPCTQKTISTSHEQANTTSRAISRPRRREGRGLHFG